ncbi:hypothetical protein GQ55_2G064400 [Panicum hallii var. hallii]|uniref:DUF868 domain-containing protein n=1 Tax=Panicum hallii var. hallii TaxID=1504633 RepID=A0A2T7EM39_9POAL|nr:hypothetical protein GQ55_2G064400 [Panicum hallii var. hallii]
MMRDLTCFGDASVQIADAASSSSSSGTGGGGARGRGKAPAAARSRVTCLYHARLAGRPCALSVTWTRGGGLAGQAAAVSVVAVDAASGDRLCRADVKPWLFAKRKGSKSLDVAASSGAAGSTKVDVFWDLSGARFGPAPEPLEGFYVAVVCDREMVLLLGDMRKEAYRKTGAGRPAVDALLVARREHVVGKKVFSAMAQFCHHGRCHDIVIECDTASAKDPSLVIHIDRRPVMRVRRLAWKFRGNQTILVDGLPVEVFWDVHGWLFGSATSSAVFMFQTCQAPEKSMSWAYLQIFKEHQLQGHGFSLIIHAWKVE